MNHKFTIVRCLYMYKYMYGYISDIDCATSSVPFSFTTFTEDKVYAFIVVSSDIW